MKLALLEDEKKLRTFLKKGLSNAEISVDDFDNIEDIFLALMSNQYDVIVLDRLIKGIDSINYISDIRKKSPLSKIIILSALSDPEERVKGLDEGADDYLVKPFHLDELMARIRALGRRYEPKQSDPKILKYKDLSLNLDRQRVERSGQKIDLSSKEYKCLAFLLRRPNKIFSKIQLLDQVWEIQHYPESNVVEVLLNHLRKKVDKDFEEKYIHSRRHVGYWLGDPDL